MNVPLVEPTHRSVHLTDRAIPKSHQRWGDFGGSCLISACQPNADLFMPDGQALGLAKSSSAVLGTFRTADGSIHRFLRVIGPYRSPDGCFVFTNRDDSQLRRQRELEQRTYDGGIRTSCDGDVVTFRPPGNGEFTHGIDRDRAWWREADLLAVDGHRLAPATQWFNPWRDGGGALAVTTKFRASGTVFGEPAEGFFAHEVHYFPPGNDFFNSPYGWGGREVHWGHFATAFDDGTSIDGSIAWGPSGWGFALVTDETGTLHADDRSQRRRRHSPQRISGPAQIQLPRPDVGLAVGAPRRAGGDADGRDRRRRRHSASSR